MTYVLENILNIRKHREQFAMNRLFQARKEVNEARNLKERNAKQLLDYSAWRKDEELRLFEEIKRKYNKIHRLNYFNQCIEFMREKQNQLVESLEKSNQLVLQKESNLEKARGIYSQSCRERKKLEEHRDICLQAKELRDERLAEEEIDETNTIRYNNYC